MKILILGGYGVFGGRLAELLADLPDLELLICGRDLTRAEAFCARFRGKPRAIPCAFDRRDIADTPQRFAPDLVVDASDRKSGVQGKSVSVRLGLGGRRII